MLLTSCLDHNSRQHLLLNQCILIVKKREFLCWLCMSWLQYWHIYLGGAAYISESLETLPFNDAWKDTDEAYWSISIYGENGH